MTTCDTAVVKCLSDGCPLYVFGYGSLVYKHNFPHNRRIPCRIKGYRRVFYQGSTDHRGVPGKPGRVVTLLPHEPHYDVVGAVFEVLPADIEEVVNTLDLREQGGYDRVLVNCLAKHSDEVLVKDAVCYIANHQNSEYLGEDTEENIARHICDCAGASGHNTEYLFKLADWLREEGTHDAHVFAIDAHARRICADRLVVAEKSDTTQ